MNALFFPPRGVLIIVLAALASAGPLRAQVEEHFRLGTQAMAQGEFEQASKEFETVIRQRPGFAEAHFNLGLAHEQLGRMQDAVRDLRQALHLNPTLRGANLFLGVAYYKLNDFSSAREAVQRELKSNPKDPQALMWLGVIELGDGMASRAEHRLWRITPIT